MVIVTLLQWAIDCGRHHHWEQSLALLLGLRAAAFEGQGRHGNQVDLFRLVY